MPGRRGGLDEHANGLVEPAALGVLGQSLGAQCIHPAVQVSELPADTGPRTSTVTR